MTLPAASCHLPLVRSLQPPCPSFHLSTGPRRFPPQSLRLCCSLRLEHCSLICLRDRLILFFQVLIQMIFSRGVCPPIIRLQVATQVTLITVLFPSEQSLLIGRVFCLFFIYSLTIHHLCAVSWRDKDLGCLVRHCEQRLEEGLGHSKCLLNIRINKLIAPAAQNLFPVLVFSTKNLVWFLGERC